MPTITRQRYIHIGVKAPISNTRGSHSRSCIKAPRRGGQCRSIVTPSPKKIFHGMEERAKALQAKLAAADASALALVRPDPSVWPASRRSAYGVRSTVPAPAPRHRLSNKRSGCGNEKSWLSIHQRPCLFIQQPHGVRGFNARSTVATPGITRGQQVRSFAEAPRVWYGKAVEQAGESDASFAEVVMVRQAGRGSVARNTVLAPAVAGDDDRQTRTIGRVPANRSTIVEQARATTERSFAAPLEVNKNIWEQEHMAVLQEWEKMMALIALDYEHIELAHADAAPSAPRPVGTQTPLSPPPARKHDGNAVTLLASSTTYPIRPLTVKAAKSKPFWECCECMNKNYMFREECGRCEFPKVESIRVSTPVQVVAIEAC